MNAKLLETLKLIRNLATPTVYNMTQANLALDAILKTARDALAADAPDHPFHPCLACGYTGVCSAHQQPDRTCKTCYPDAPEGPWEIYIYYLDGEPFEPRRYNLWWRGLPLTWDQAVKGRDALNAHTEITESIQQGIDEAAQNKGEYIE